MNMNLTNSMMESFAAADPSQARDQFMKLISISMMKFNSDLHLHSIKISIPSNHANNANNDNENENRDEGLNKISIGRPYTIPFLGNT
jgi:hypothetical protein